MRRRSLGGGTTAAAILLAACGSDGDPVDTPTLGVTTTIDTVDGTVRVTNSGTPPEWRLARVASIGPESLSGTGSPDEFGRIFDVALGPDDAVFVADGMNSEVRVFGIDGVHRRTFGRDGEGPGEFARLYSVAWLGDRLLASMPAPTERRSFTPPAIGANHVLTVRRGDFDLDYVDIWRIEREGAR